MGREALALRSFYVKERYAIIAANSDIQCYPRNDDR